MGLERGGVVRITFDEVMCGVLLGDGGLEKRGNARLKIQRKVGHKEYNDWLMRVLSEWLDFGPSWSGEYFDKRTGKTYGSSEIKTRVDKRLTELHSLWYAGKKRVIPMKYVEKNFTDLSLAIWYLDDGTLTRSNGYYRVVFGTNRYNKVEVEFFGVAVE